MGLRVAVTCLVLTVTLAVSGFLTGDTNLGFAALATVGAAWLARDFHRSLQGGSA